MLYFRWLGFLAVVTISIIVVFFCAYNIAFEDVWYGDYSSLRLRTAWKSASGHVNMATRECPVKVARIPADINDQLTFLQEQVETRDRGGANEESRPKVRSMKKIRFKVKPKVRPKAKT